MVPRRRRGESWQRARTDEAQEVLRRATAAFVGSVEALTRPRGVRSAELAVLLRDLAAECADAHLDDPAAVRAQTREWGNYRGGRRGMSFERLTRAMSNAAALHGWRDDTGIAALLQELKPLDIEALNAAAEAHDRDVERDAAREMVAAAALLMERFRWPLQRVLRFMQIELREQLQDSADADTEFRAWSAQWRRGNPDA